MRKNVAIRALLIGAFVPCLLSAAADAYTIPPLGWKSFNVTKVIMNGELVTANDPLAKSVVGIKFESADEEGLCTGFLIDVSHVITAAHCAIRSPESYSIIFGLTLDSKNRVGIVAKPVIHPDWKPEDIGEPTHSDIAVLTLASPAPAGYIPAQIYTQGVQQELATALGFGFFLAIEDAPDGTLRKGTVMLGDFSFKTRGIDVNQHNYQAPCQGDSGGPVFIDGEVVGLVSWGRGRGENKQCGESGHLTFLPTYKSWIEQVVGHKLGSKQTETSRLLVARKVAMGVSRGWEVYCRERKNKTRFCAARPRHEDGEPIFSLCLDQNEGLVIGFEAPAALYRLAPTVIAIDDQKIKVEVTNVICGEEGCLHVMKPTSSTSDVARALRAGNKIRFYATSPPDFSLAGSSVALSALFESAKEANVPVPGRSKGAHRKRPFPR